MVLSLDVAAGNHVVKRNVDHAENFLLEAEPTAHFLRKTKRMEAEDRIGSEDDSTISESREGRTWVRGHIIVCSSACIYRFVSAALPE